MLRIIGNMTGNSMDAIDLVLTEFDGDYMRDICTYSKPYSSAMQEKIATLRTQVYNKTRSEIEKIADFQTIHDEYIRQIADCINEMCELNHISKNTIDAIGFHGKTLDHNPPSRAIKERTQPYTLQIGSGQMLADLTGIKVVYDFRSDFIQAGFEGAPLVAPHNAHIAQTEGDGCYYNGGNTANFAFIENSKAVISADAGPCNEYIDSYVRANSNLPFDKNGALGIQGYLDRDLLQKIFDYGRQFYETALPKSGDPAYYHQAEIFQYIQNTKIDFAVALHTFEYFAAYIAVHALTLLADNISIPQKFILFGGGWKNPLVRQYFADLLAGKGYVLPEHEQQFAALYKRMNGRPNIGYSNFGTYMEARLFADMAYYKLTNRAWEIPETERAGAKIISGIVAIPQSPQIHYSDCLNRAAKK